MYSEMISNGFPRGYECISHGFWNDFLQKTWEIYSKSFWNPFEINGVTNQTPWVVHSTSFRNHLEIHLKSMGNPFKIHGEPSQHPWGTHSFESTSEFIGSPFKLNGGSTKNVLKSNSKPMESTQNTFKPHSKSMGNPFKINGEPIQKT